MNTTTPPPAQRQDIAIPTFQRQDIAIPTFQRQDIARPSSIVPPSMQSIDFNQAGITAISLTCPPGTYYRGDSVYCSDGVSMPKIGVGLSNSLVRQIQPMRGMLPSKCEMSLSNEPDAMIHIQCYK